MATSSEMNSVIATCSCHDTPEFAKEAFGLLFNDRELPPMVSGYKKLLDAANQHPNTNFGKILMALAKSKEKFAFYIVSDNNGNIVEQWDLMKGFKCS